MSRETCCGTISMPSRRIGVTPPPWDEAWRAITFGMLHGFFLWGITTKMQPAIIATLLHRLGTAVADRNAAVGFRKAINGRGRIRGRTCR